MVSLYDYQWKAIDELKNGSILCGGVGSGKTLTAIGYYLFKVCGGGIKTIGSSTKKTDCLQMKHKHDLYIITTAQKRDKKEWEMELAQYMLHPEENAFGVKVVVDSWNNIKKYVDVKNAFFIFDEQRVVGNGTWVKTFLKITFYNKWILLSATPADTYSDLIPVFIANGFYKNRTEFFTKHAVFARFSKYPKVERWVGTKELKRNVDRVTVIMKDDRLTNRHVIDLVVPYDKMKYRTVFKDRWDPWDDEPIAEMGKLLYLTRRVVNENEHRILKVGKILGEKKRAIVFYNFTYELNMLREMCKEMGFEYAEWNGEKHQPLPTGERWAYLVQYTAGCEGWNCITTDTVIFFSQNYSYRITEQASGRIDRINTPYKELFYYHILTDSNIDLAIRRCLKNKKNFKESSFMKR